LSTAENKGDGKRSGKRKRKREGRRNIRAERDGGHFAGDDFLGGEEVEKTKAETLRVDRKRGALENLDSGGGGGEENLSRQISSGGAARCSETDPSK